MRSISGFRFSSFDFRVTSFLSRYGKLGILLVAAAIWLAHPAPLAAQGCAMCYTSAAAAKKAGLQALQNGILILGIPPLVMFIGIFWYVFRRREGFDDADIGEERGRDEMPSAPPAPLPSELGEEPEEVLAAAAWSGDRDQREDSIPSRQGH